MSSDGGRWLERSILAAVIGGSIAWGWRVNDRANRIGEQLAETNLKLARVDGRIDVMNERIVYTNQTLARIEQALKERP